MILADLGLSIILTSPEPCQQNTPSLLKDGSVHAFSFYVSLGDTRSVMYGWLKQVLDVLPKLPPELCTSALPTTV